MLHRALLSMTLLATLIAGFVADLALGPVHVGLAQEPATPELVGDLPDGIEVVMLAEGVADALPAAPAQFRLERVTMESGDEQPLRPSAGPELLYIETGTFLIADELGLEGAYSEGSQLFLPAGVSYGVRNDGSEPATMLRLGLLTPGDSASPEGVAAQEGGGSEVLLEAELASLPSPPARVVLARATWEPGTDLGQRTFAGPVGLLMESGTLRVAGPSGIEGQLTAGRSIVLPAEVPNRQRNVGDEPAEVLMVGVIPVGQGMSQPVVPTPTATAVVTATPIPPAESTTPTSTPEPPEAAVPAAGTVLYEASVENGGFEEWTLEGGWLLFEGALVNDGSGGSIFVPISFPDLPNIAVEVDGRVVEESGRFNIWLRSGDLEFSVAPVCYVARSWIVGEQAWEQCRWDIDITQSTTYELEVDGNDAAVYVNGEFLWGDDDNRLLRVAGGDIGISTSDSLQVEVTRVRVIAGDNGGPAASLSDESTQVAEIEATDVASDLPVVGGPTTSILVAMLPAASDVPADFQLTEEGARSAAEITQTFPDPADAAQRFAAWGWQENAYRHFAAPDGSVVEASLHWFGSETAAAEAMVYLAESRTALLGLRPVPVEPFGDQTSAIAGLVPDGYEVTFYIRRGAVVARITAVSPSGDPTAVAADVARAMLAQVGDGPAAARSTMLSDMLPTLGEVPEGLVQTEDRLRTLAQVSDVYLDPGDLMQRFSGWGWRGNAVRTFGVPAGASPAADRITYLSVSVHQFDGATGAANALDYALQDESAEFGLTELSVDPIGDQARAIAGEVPDGNDVVLFVQLGAVIIVVDAISPIGNPMLAATSVARTIVDKVA